MPRYARVTLKPLLSRKSPRRVDARRSSYAVSGFAWIARDSSKSASRRWSIAFCARFRSAAMSGIRPMLASRRDRCRLMPGDHREDDAVERAVGLLEQGRGLGGLERTPASDMRDLRHEARAEVQERLRRLAARQTGAFRVDAVFTAERLGLRRVLLLAGASSGIEMTEKEIAHAYAALAEPAQRALVEACVPVLIGDVGAHTLPELRGDLVGRLAHRGERRTPDRALTWQQRIDGRAKESSVTARGSEDVDLPVVSPAAEGVRIHAEHSSGLAEGEPVATLACCGRCGNTVNLGEPGEAHRTSDGGVVLSLARSPSGPGR